MGNSKVWAIISIIITIIIGFVGLNAYGSGTGYMTFLGIELSPTGFGILIAVFLVWDALSIYSAFVAGPRKQAEQQKAEDAKRQEMREKAKLSEKLEAPCTVVVERQGNFATRKLLAAVYLNGNYQTPLENGQTVTLTTDVKYNTIYVKLGEISTSKTLDFEAAPGGEAKFQFVGAGTVLKQV